MSLADILKKHLAPDPFDLIEFLNTLTTEEILSPPTPDQIYRVSHVIKLCPREEVLRFKTQKVKKQKINAKLRRTFNFGEAFHLMMQNEILGPRGILLGDWICPCGEIYLNQVYPSSCVQCKSIVFEYRELTPINREHGISAHVDGILLAGNVKKVLELKTINAMGFKLVSEFNKRPNEAHKNQLNLYMWLTGIPRGVLLYFDKNESQLFQFEEKLDQAYIDQVLENLRAAREGMRTGIVPPHRICETQTCSRAKACPVSKVCFS